MEKTYNDKGSDNFSHSVDSENLSIENQEINTNHNSRMNISRGSDQKSFDLSKNFNRNINSCRNLDIARNSSSYKRNWKQSALCKHKHISTGDSLSLSQRGSTLALRSTMMSMTECP